MHLPVPPARFALFALPVLAAAIWFGLRNKPDPLWLEAGRLLQERHSLVNEVPDSLQRLFCSLHNLPYRPGDSSALELISKPYLSNIEWTRFRDFSQFASQRRFMVVSGVTGVGATKQTKHLARLIAGDPDNLIQIDCAPQFDLEYHKKYIGKEEYGRFLPGELLVFWQKCWQHPERKYVAVIDNFDKINPETFFGPKLWEALSSPRDTAVLGGKPVLVPSNFYLLSVTHLGPGSLIEMNEEHFKRLGRPYVLDPNPRELLAGLRQQADKLKQSDDPDAPSRLSALQDSAQLHRFLYYFLKTNQLLRNRYADGYQLGQGSNVRQFYRDEDLPDLKQTYINHINALLPSKPLNLRDFDAMDYTVRSGGLEANSSFWAHQVQYLQDTGYFVEITMVATTALLTFLAGWWVFRRREQLIRLYGDRAQQVYAGFEKQLISAEVAARRLEEIKNEVDSLVMRRRLNYTEGLYFLAFVEDKVKRIEFARNVSENFLELFNTFMEDNVLTESEYLKLRQFLQTIRHKIPEEVYLRFLEKVETTFAANN